MNQRILDYNRSAWDHQVQKKNCWTVPVTSEQINHARKGDWSLVLTPTKPVPGGWFPDLENCKVLCLASGGGQQGPILSAAGADVTVFDNSPQQLAQDQMVANRDELNLQTIQGDMADLSAMESDRFDLVFHPCSNTFVPDVNPVWRECYRVLKKGGTMISGFCNPVLFLFDDGANSREKLVVRFEIPYSDEESLEDSARQALIEAGEPFCFGHTLTDLIGGQCAAGFSIIDFYEDHWEEGGSPIDRYIDCFIGTRAIKL